MRIAIAILLTILVATAGTPSDKPANEYGTIAGTVVDVKTQKPLVYANIVLLGTTKGAMSMEDGSFEITNVPPGTYTLKVMMMGYKTIEKSNVRVYPGQTVHLMFQMEVTIVATTQVINVVGEREAVDVTACDVRASMSEEQVKEMPVDDVIDAVALKTGIVKTGSELHARGGRSGEIQMQSDGVPVNDPLGGGRSSATLGNRSGPSGGRAAALKQSLGPSGPMTPQVAMPCPPKSKKSGAACRAQRQTPACVSPCKPRCLKPPRIRCGSIRIPKEPWNTESYDRIYENEFLAAIDNPLSTFSVDVDAASYSNTRRYLENGVLPPPDAVRIEEFINYFSYDYPEPGDGHPFSITADVSSCPWNPEHRLVHIGLKGREIFVEDAPPSNLVFLLDVSGSMAPPNKLPLVKRGLKLLVQNLRAKDRIAIVVYASSAGLHLRSTPGDEKEKLLDAILQLHACGSTAGGAGIELAYKIAQKNFIEEGNNRVILTTDGDFNTGPSSDSYIVRLIEEKRKSGVFLSVLGFGTGNLKDSKLEKLADKGNGHYVYVDNLFEAKKVFVNELGGTLFTIAKDVKIQIEFNPARVESYRLIGYENRLLKKEDFDDDKKDAGEIGAGHTVTALYEIVPADAKEQAAKEDDLKYMDVKMSEEAHESPEILTVKFRYKHPDEDESTLLSQTLLDEGADFEDASTDFRFSAAVAEFGMLLRDSEFKGEADFGHVLKTARKAKGKDKEGYRAEFVRLVEMCQLLVAQR